MSLSIKLFLRDHAEGSYGFWWWYTKYLCLFHVQVGYDIEELQGDGKWMPLVFAVVYGKARSTLIEH